VLACIDVDNFKQVNDSYFHTGGDRVLTALASLLSKNIRQADVIARIGGEEVAIIMPETTLPAALILCERLRSTVEHYDWNEIALDLRVRDSKIINHPRALQV
jgi:diguanylate cyclase (GGDEF)-like protein